MSGGEPGAGGGADVTLTFETSNHALWAEELARERRIPVEVVPAPPQSEALCGLALLLPHARVEELEAACSDEGIRFRRWI